MTALWAGLAALVGGGAGAAAVSWWWIGRLPALVRQVTREEQDNELTKRLRRLREIEDLYDRPAPRRGAGNSRVSTAQLHRNPERPREG